MLNEVQSDASNNRYLINSHRTEELLDRDLFIGDLCRSIEDITICYANHLGLETCLLSRCTDIKVW